MTAWPMTVSSRAAYNDTRSRFASLVADELVRAAHSEALRRAAQKHCRLGLGPDDHEALTGFWCHVPPGILGCLFHKLS